MPPKKYFQDLAKKTLVLADLSRIPALKAKKIKISLVFVTSDFLKSLNLSLRHKKGQCQELSFNFWQSGKHIEGEYLGEILIDPVVIGSEKSGYAQTFAHALLHIFGYNHEGRGLRRKSDEKAMSEIEAKIKEHFLKTS